MHRFGAGAVLDPPQLSSRICSPCTQHSQTGLLITARNDGAPQQRHASHSTPQRLAWGAAQLRNSPALQLCRWQHHRPAAAHRLQVSASLTSTLAPVQSWGGSISQALARALGYAVLVGACFRSVPQIARILRARSASGVSLTSNIAELLAYSITIAYNLRQGYAFSTYGEIVTCWIQDVALVALIARFSGVEDWRVFVGAILFSLYCWWLGSGGCSPETLRFLQASTISIIALGGRLPQILMNVRRRNSGELSMTTCLLNLMGNIARVFTTLVLTGDSLILVGNAVQGTLNSVLLWQTASTAARRASRRARGVPQDGIDDAEELMGVSPAALEAAEGESEESGAMGDGGAAAAVAGGDGGGDGGGYGGVASAFMDPSPVDMPMDSERKYE